MARSKFEDLSVVSELEGFTIRQHVSTKAGEPITTPGGRVIEYPIARISRDNTEGVDVGTLVEAMDNAFKKSLGEQSRRTRPYRVSLTGL